MTARCNLFYVRARLSMLLSLVFFILITGCRQAPPGKLRLVWSGNRATGIVIPAAVCNQPEKQIRSLQVYLHNSRFPMLGEYEPVENGILFKPLIPLSPGKRYEVLFNKKPVGGLQVPGPAATHAPEVVALYPSADTLPENLLKIYLQFSSPMREGEALQHIRMLDDQADTLAGIFLDLQPELWNSDRTTLTLWLDPGRIKRGLIPNQRMGNPLQKGAWYTLVTDADWKDTRGVPLRAAFLKRFLVSGRDSTLPRPGQWAMKVPAAATRQPLHIGFHEPLDPFLVPETMQIFDDQDRVVQGRMRLLNKEREGEFYPERPWPPGRYRLRVAAYLEDLAGNNLNKVFDRDVTLQPKREDAYVERAFDVR